MAGGWHRRRRLTVARGGARLAAQARGNLRACPPQGVKRRSSPEGCVGGERAELGQRGSERWRSSELEVVVAPALDRRQLASAPQSTSSARKNDGAHTGSDFGATRGRWWPASCSGGVASWAELPERLDGARGCG
jgi:hypothetical protein